MTEQEALEYIRKNLREALEQTFITGNSENAADMIFQHWLNMNTLYLKEGTLYRSDTGMPVAYLGSYSYDGRVFNVQVKLMSSIQFVEVKLDIGDL